MRRYECKVVLTWLATLGLLGLAACGPDESGTVQPNNGANNIMVMEDMGPPENNNPDPADMDEPVEDMKDPVTPDMKMPELDMPPMMEDMKDEPDMRMPEPDMAPQPCMADGDCADPQVCAVASSDGARTCQDPEGPGITGDACTDGSECRSGLCLNGACANPCVTGADCPNGFLCEERFIPLDNGGSTNFNVCVEAPRPCQSDGDCDDPQICVIDRSGMGADLTCQDPIPGSGDLGDACAMDNECRSGLCLDDVCSRPCERPNDCSADGSFICEPTQVSTGSGANVSVNVCKPRPPTQCLSNNQCTAPNSCVAERGPREVDFVCGDPNQGGGQLGDTCTQDSECAQNFCLDGVCTTPCQGMGDCSGAPDYSCELREVQLSGNNRDNVQVCVPPVPCQDDGACKITEECYVRRGPGDIETVCRPGNVGGGLVGQVCDDDMECAANLCYAGRFDDVCSKPCSDNADCGSVGYSCQLTGVTSSNGATVDVQICAPDPPGTCTSNNDCPTGTTCAIVPNTAGNALESICIPSTGKLATGVACGSDDECASRVCLQGSCAAPCTDSNQCGVSQVCLNNTVSKSGLAGDFYVCERLQDQTCDSSADCTDGVRVCGDLRNQGGTVTPYCRFPISGGAQLGSDCAANTDCREGRCLNTSQECSVVCAQDADCSAAASQVCSTFGFGGGNDINMCVRGCTDNASCQTGDVCTINGDVTDNDIDQICGAPIGAKELGEVCASGNECRTGLCLTTILYNGISCTSDAQCGLGLECRCPVDQPNCNSGRQCAEIRDRCTPRLRRQRRLQRRRRGQPADRLLDGRQRHAARRHRHQAAVLLRRAVSSRPIR